MAREHLSQRFNWQWQNEAGGSFSGEQFYTMMVAHLQPSPLRIIRDPSSLRGIYGHYEVSGSPHGIRPQYEIVNEKSGKRVWVEFRRQGPRGNAHERICKFFMPGIIESARIIGNHGPGVIPFWFVFTDALATEERYIREIGHWFQKYERHVLLWENDQNHYVMLNHFHQNIEPMFS